MSAGNPVHVSDLLPRKERALDFRYVDEMIRGKKVAVTGAGGFIGSELSRLVATFGPALVTLIDNCENNLYYVDRSVAGAEKKSVYADVRDSAQMQTILWGQDLVIHAAAMKHVPICEENRYEALRTNVIGTESVIQASGKARLIFVSTDKAVKPTSVMGRTKAMAEDLMRGTGRATVVRFGNVIGSTGSVVPLFQEQISRGGPLTITHEEMTRYFMTVREASDLILQAGSHGIGTYVLDMGDPVKIMDLARDMIKLSGRRDIDIKITGIRAGEKLHEELSDLPLNKTNIDGLLKVAA